MNKEAISLLIHGGRIIDPGRGIDQLGDLLIAEGRILQVGGTVILSRSLERGEGKVKNLNATGMCSS